MVKIGTDSSEAKSFVGRRGLRKMRHLKIRDLWLQQEVLDKKVVVSKVAGEEKPADLMTKTLGMTDIASRLAHMNIRIVNDGGK